jgi:aerobic carbon-monoxide dehydrogenase medium subunit
MKFFKPTSLPDLFDIVSKIEGKKYYLAGGTDINVQIKKEMIKDEPVIFINHLDEIRGIAEDGDDIMIGALTSYKDLLESDIIAKHLPYLQTALGAFASPLLQAMATLGGNLANGSPTADVTPPLLVLDAKLKILARSKMRVIPLAEFFLGYKKFNMKANEIIGGIIISKTAEKGFESFHKKVGSRSSLTIAKIGLAGLKRVEDGIVKEIKLAAGSLNEFPRRLPKLEEFLTGKELATLNFAEMEEILKQEITPISDLRSDKGYRWQVTVNLLKTFLAD